MSRRRRRRRRERTGEGGGRAGEEAERGEQGAKWERETRTSESDVQEAEVRSSPLSKRVLTEGGEGRVCPGMVVGRRHVRGRGVEGVSVSNVAEGGGDVEGRLRDGAAIRGDGVPLGDQRGVTRVLLQPLGRDGGERTRVGDVWACLNRGFDRSDSDDVS